MLVSPGNPLKPSRGMARFCDRLRSARAIADGRRRIASAIEASFGTRYTVDTLRLLRRRFPRVRFVWVMGADILDQLPRWRRWKDIVRGLPFVVLPRPGYTYRAFAGQAAHRLRYARRPTREATVIARRRNGWVFLPVRENTLSSTAIREAGKGFVP